MVKYTMEGMLDLLAFTEHTNNVHLVDARNYNEEQVIKVTLEGEREDLAGLSFSKDCKQMVVGE